jgi:transcriptional regulator with XRE-family HTH domain
MANAKRDTAMAKTRKRRQPAARGKRPFKAFGERLRAAREAKGLTVERAAKRIAVKPADWQSWEDGKIDPPAEAGILATRLLGVTMEWLFTGVDPWGYRLKTSRKAKGLTIRQAAQLVGVKAGEWGSWERSAREPSFDKGCDIAEALGVNPLWLALGRGQPHKPPRKRQSSAA